MRICKSKMKHRRIKRNRSPMCQPQIMSRHGNTYIPPMDFWLPKCCNWLKSSQDWSITKLNPELQSTEWDSIVTLSSGLSSHRKHPTGQENPFAFFLPVTDFLSTSKKSRFPTFIYAKIADSWWTHRKHYNTLVKSLQMWKKQLYPSREKWLSKLWYNQK